MLSAFVMLTAICTNLRFSFQTDFISFWAAAKLALSGMPSAAYNLNLHKAMEATAADVSGLIPFPYPPTYLLAILPFGLLPYAIAHAVWVGTTLTAYLAAAHKLVKNSAVLAMAFPPAIICGVGGQNSFLMTAIFMAAMAALKTRPFISGLIFGLLAFKPHLGLLLPLAFVAAREWRAFCGAAFATLGLIVLSVIAFGTDSWIAFIRLLPFAGSIASEGLVSWNKMASVYASLRLIGVPELIAWLAHGLFAIWAIMQVWRVWRASDDTQCRAAVLAAATLLISPYIFVYDQLLLVPALAYLWQHGGHEKTLSAIYVVAIISLASNFYMAAAISVAPILPIVVLALMRRHEKRADTRPTRRSGGFTPLSVPTV